MKYVIMNNSEAITSGLLSEDHPYKHSTGEDKVVFKKDLITIFIMNGNEFNYDYKELDTEQALNTIDGWQQ